MVLCLRVFIHLLLPKKKEHPIGVFFFVLPARAYLPTSFPPWHGCGGVRGEGIFALSRSLPPVWCLHPLSQTFQKHAGPQVPHLFTVRRAVGSARKNLESDIASPRRINQPALVPELLATRPPPCQTILSQT